MGTLAERDLPDDVEALKKLLLARQAETRQLLAEIAERKAIKAADDLKIANLASIITMLQRAQYGTRSEKLRIDPLNEDQYAFVFDELETGLSELSAGVEKRDGGQEGYYLEPDQLANMPVPPTARRAPLCAMNVRAVLCKSI